MSYPNVEQQEIFLLYYNVLTADAKVRSRIQTASEDIDRRRRRNNIMRLISDPKSYYGCYQAPPTADDVDAVEAELKFPITSTANTHGGTE